MYSGRMTCPHPHAETARTRSQGLLARAPTLHGMAVLVAAALAASLPACKSAPTVNPAFPTVAATAGPDAPRRPALAAGMEEELLARICKDHPPPCELLYTLDAGRDARGRQLVVLVIDPDDAPEGKDREDDADSEGEEGEDGDESEDGADSESQTGAASEGETGEDSDESEGSDEDMDVVDDDPMEHAEREYWVGVIDDSRDPDRLVSWQLAYSGLITISEIDLYPHTSATEVEVAQNRLIVKTQSLGSGGDSSQRIEYQLSPFRVAVSAGTSSRDIFKSSQEQYWDWLAFRGWEARAIEVCRKDRGSVITEPDYENASFIYVPIVNLPAAYEQGAWRETALGSCAAVVDSEHAFGMNASSDVTENMMPAGFVIDGQPGATNDASMKLVMGNARTLYVEISDDTWKTQSKRWLGEDHVEIWLGPKSDCYDSTRSKALAQWVVLVGSGKVIPAYGKPRQALTVEHVAGQGDAPARLKITLPDMKYETITVTYSDSDDGKTQESLLATSALRHGLSSTLGEVRAFAAGEAVCQVEDGRLMAKVPF